MNNASDFQQRVTSDYYAQQICTGQTCTFVPELHVLHQGVPAEYAPGVADYAWSQGHSVGFHEVLAVAQDLVQIFQRS